ncbi:MAG: 50S ribosomal protein L25 [Actinobacteria bacterium]|nr:50S ribosomal protein L25 [Actinomycetota bacterium]
MSQVTLRARTGRTPGSRSSRRVRRQGLVPAIVYGDGLEPLSVAVDAHDLHVALHTESGSNAIISLEIDGGQSLTTMARMIERHPYRNEYRHVDFVKVDLNQTVHAEVAIHFEGSPIGVKEGGVFSPARTHVSIEALPTAIPPFIELEVSDVELGASRRVADLPEVEGVTYLDDPETVVMSITAPAAEVVEEPAEEEAAEAGEEPVESEAEETTEPAADGEG